MLYGNMPCVRGSGDNDYDVKEWHPVDTYRSHKQNCTNGVTVLPLFS